jgi:transcriptional regulator with XRE-family HTH domain
VDDEREVGRRIARARRRRGLSQSVLAGLVGRSESWLSQVERGKRSADSHSVLTRLAEVLRVDIGELCGPVTDGGDGVRPYSAAVQIEQAMMSYAALEDSITRRGSVRAWNVRNLQGRIRMAYYRYQATAYEETGRLLPALIMDVEAACRAAGPSHSGLCQIRAHVYDTTAALLNRVGEHGLAWTAADRAMSAAEQAGQPLGAALGAYRLSYVLASRKHPRRAVELAMTAAEALEPVMKSPSPEQLSVYGALHLAAASAAAAEYDSAASPALLRRAGDIAERFGRDANLMGTAFGPVNVAIHLMSASVRLGDARTAIRIGESLDATAIPAGLIGRRTQVNLDLARAYALRRQDAAAVNALLAAELLSPQLVRLDGRTRDVITGLLHREHRASTPQLRPLASRAGVI